MVSRALDKLVHSVLAAVVALSACYTGPHCGDFTRSREWGEVLMLDFPRGMVKSCLRAGANPNARNARGMTPLHYAAMMRPEDVKALLDARARVNAPHGLGSTALHMAALFGDDPRSVRLLLDAGAWLSAPDSEGNSPLHGAASIGRAVVLEELISAGASPQARNIRGETPLHSVALRLGLGRPSRPAGTSFVSDQIEGPLIIEALLRAGANPQAPSDQGLSPIDIFPGIEEWWRPALPSRRVRPRAGDRERTAARRLRARAVRGAAREVEEVDGAGRKAGEVVGGGGGVWEVGEAVCGGRGVGGETLEVRLG